MDSLPITAEALAFTEKKMDMTLEDIIKMSKKKNPGGKKPHRQPIKKRPFQNGNSNQNQGSVKVKRIMESRSSIRQGVLAQRRSNLGSNQFTTMAAKKAASMPVRNNRAARWNKPSAVTLVQRRPLGDAFQNGKVQNQTPRTMDALFAQMKAERMSFAPQQQAYPAQGHQFQQQRRVQQQQPRRGRGYGNRNVHGNQ